MLYGAKNGILKLQNGSMEYIRFGTGKRVLIMLPGLGDALRSMKGTALPMALMYRMFAKDFTVYAFSRIEPMPEGYATRDMARDQAEAMTRLGIERADILGVSMGGMIAQWLAIDFPERVEKLILTVTCARPNPVLKESIDEWVSCAKRDDHTAYGKQSPADLFGTLLPQQSMDGAPSGETDKAQILSAAVHPIGSMSEP